MSTPDITKARAATADIEGLLQPAIDELRSALNITERSGVFTDIDAILVAMLKMKIAIGQAQHVARQAEWPMSPAARRQVVIQLYAGIAQVRAPGLPSRRRGIEPSPRSTPSDGAKP